MLNFHFFTLFIFLSSFAYLFAEEIEYEAAKDLIIVFNVEEDGNVKADLYNPTEDGMTVIDPLLKRTDVIDILDFGRARIFTSKGVNDSKQFTILRLSLTAPSTNSSLDGSAVIIPIESRRVQPEKGVLRADCKIYKSSFFGWKTKGWVANCGNGFRKIDAKELSNIVLLGLNLTDRLPRFAQLGITDEYILQNMPTETVERINQMSDEEFEKYLNALKSKQPSRGK